MYNIQFIWKKIQITVFYDVLMKILLLMLNDLLGNDFFIKNKDIYKGNNYKYKHMLNKEM